MNVRYTFNMNLSPLQQLDAAHHLHPFTNHHDMHAVGTHIITEGSGVWLKDSEGRRLLDALATFRCLFGAEYLLHQRPTGHGPDKLLRLRQTAVLFDDSQGAIHHLRAVRSRIHMAMRAGLVAFAAYVDLQRLEDPTFQRDPVPGELFLESVHVGYSGSLR